MSNGSHCRVSPFHSLPVDPCFSQSDSLAQSARDTTRPVHVRGLPVTDCPCRNGSSAGREGVGALGCGGKISTSAGGGGQPEGVATPATFATQGHALGSVSWKSQAGQIGFRPMRIEHQRALRGLTFAFTTGRLRFLRLGRIESQQSLNRGALCWVGCGSKRIGCPHDLESFFPGFSAHLSPSGSATRYPAFASMDPDHPSRPEMVRRILVQHFTSVGYLEPDSE